MSLSKHLYAWEIELVTLGVKVVESCRNHICQSPQQMADLQSQCCPQQRHPSKGQQTTAFSAALGKGSKGLGKWIHLWFGIITIYNHLSQTALLERVLGDGNCMYVTSYVLSNWVVHHMYVVCLTPCLHTHTLSLSLSLSLPLSSHIEFIRHIYPAWAY